MKLRIKNMISYRSKAEVFAVFNELGLNPIKVEIGEVEIAQKQLSKMEYNIMSYMLRKNDYELVIDKEQIVIEKVKSVIIKMIHFSDELPKTKYSCYISEVIGINYTYLSKMFSKATNVTIERFIIVHKIERVKRLLLFNELTLSEISWKLQYSSVAHLSAQFKKITGTTISVFKQLKNIKLIALDELTGE